MTPAEIYLITPLGEKMVGSVDARKRKLVATDRGRVQSASKVANDGLMIENRSFKSVKLKNQVFRTNRLRSAKSHEGSQVEKKDLTPR